MSYKKLTVLPIALFALMLATGCNKVPDLSRMTQDEAKKALDKKNLSLGTVTQANLPNKTAGTVIDQDPRPGEKIPDNKTVNVVLQQSSASTNAGGNGGTTGGSSGGNTGGTTNSGTVTVPDLTGDTQDDAVVTLGNQGLVLGTVTVQMINNKPPGKIYQQDPPGNTQVQPGTPGNPTKVNVSIASDAMAPVPPVATLAQADAEKAITNAGFTPDVKPVLDSGSQAVGTVLRQSPAAGLSFAKGQPVTIEVKQDTVTMPDVVTKDQTAAQLEVFNRGLTPSVQLVFGQPGNIGKVISQQYPKDTSLARNTRVTLVVGGLHIIKVSPMVRARILALPH